jgi:hypothetical protein
MGYDTYMAWEGQTEEEKEAQFCGASPAFGHVGYLRGPYARDLFEQSEPWETPIPASDMRARLDEALETVKDTAPEEWVDVYCASLTAFVELAERKEKETGKPVLITCM